MTLRTKCVAALLGIAALGIVPEAKAWIDIEFQSKTPKPALLFCSDANHVPACAAGIDRGEVWWNPLDGDRWSNFHILHDGNWVDIRMFDARSGCSVGWGRGRGWSWQVAASADALNWSPFREVCSGGGGGTEKMQIVVLPGADGFVFEVRGKAPTGSRPCARYHYSKTNNTVTPSLCS